ncbi:MAG: putative zinc-binding peptidase [Bradyrhizobiaceae bacterium]|nr:putative zinc-binding peptidase [Bradyrhizobiaceae bacterium]
MKLFECQHCGQALYFESTHCDGCGRRLGYVPAKEIMAALEPGPADGAWRTAAVPRAGYRFCANADYQVCNWLVESDRPDIFCGACRHNRMIPDLTVPDNVAHWRKIEVAKHRLFYTLLKLRLPLTTRTEDPDGLAFDFLAAPATLHAPVVTGHSGGLITINLAEADDSERERQRSRMDEPYRTLLGHFRHEIAHYYWDHLVRNTNSIETFRDIFGDERQDYSIALQHHYCNGPPHDWPQHFVTAYASSHPWEDFAETWAHYFHMVDTLETANVFGLRVRPKLRKSSELAMVVDFDPHTAEMDRIIDAWLPLTFAVNSINRSMGLSDLYPFVLQPSVIVKLAFVHERIHQHQGAARRSNDGNTLRAIIAGLRRNFGMPGPA